MAHRFALMGCGGMGRRHLQGFGELARVRPGLVELAAVIDVAGDRAEFAAREAADLLGGCPRAFTSLDQAIRAVPDLEAVDIVTTAGTHHAAAAAALGHGLHVLVEKPMAVTLRGCRRMRQAAARHGRILSVAENYRRDPISRLARALFQAGIIGECRTVLYTRLGGGTRLFITPWRHLREQGGPLLDAGVHEADMLVNHLGPVREVLGRARLVEPRRHVERPEVAPGGFYDRFVSEYPDAVEATAPDAMIATLTFASGAWGQWVQDHSSYGPSVLRSVVLGSEGRMDIPSMRSGEPLTVWLTDAPEPVPDEELLERVPEFALDDLSAELFGGARLARYAGDFPTADRKLIAIELAELATAIETDADVEVGPDQGEAAVALVMAVFESSETGGPVTVDEVRSGAVSAYQDPIDRKLGLLD